MNFLILILLINSLLCSLFDGVTTISLDSAFFYSRLVNQTNTFILVRSDIKKAILYSNIGSTFQHSNTVPFDEVPVFYDVSDDASLMVVTGQTKILVLELENGVYVKVQTITYVDHMQSGKITNDGEMLVVGFASIPNVDIYRRDNKQYVKVQEINDSTSAVIRAGFTEDKTKLALAGKQTVIRVYQRSMPSQNYTLIQELAHPAGTVFTVTISHDRICASANTWDISCYLHTGAQYQSIPQIIAKPQASIITTFVTKNLNMIGIGGMSSNSLYLYEFMNDTYIQKGVQPLPSLPLHISIDQQQQYFIVVMLDSTFNVYYNCPSECASCVFPNNCTSCQDGYQLKGVTCVLPPSHCVNNVYQYEDVCEEYCSAKCATCTTSRDKCYECSAYYEMNEAGSCVIKSEVFDLIVRIRPFLNFVRKGSLKFMFMVLDDLWLYEYHKPNYTGQVKVVFSTIKFIEEQQWAITGLNNFQQTIEGSFTLSQYNSHSNKKYLEIARKNNTFIENTLMFLCFFVPCTIVFVLLCRFFFFRLFNYEISKFLRMWSFGWVLLEMLVMANVEYFSFLGFRLLEIGFSFSIVSKVAFVGSVIMFFFVWFGAFAAYAVYYVNYGKLARYFLINMYRFPSSYVIMTLLHGVRPFLKGLAHALFYQNNFLQLWLLLSIQFCTLMIVFTINFLYENHKSPIVFILESLYSLTLILLNFLFLLHYHYLPYDPLTLASLTQAEDVIIVTMVCIIFAKIVYECVICGLFHSVFSLCCEEEDDENSTEKESRRRSLMVITQQTVSKQILKSKSKCQSQKAEKNEQKVQENLISTGFHHQLIEFFKKKTQKKIQNEKKEEEHQQGMAKEKMNPKAQKKNKEKKKCKGSRSALKKMKTFQKNLDEEKKQKNSKLNKSQSMKINYENRISQSSVT